MSNRKIQKENLMRMVMIVLALILISCKKENEPKPVGKAVDSMKVEMDSMPKDTTPKFEAGKEYVVDSTEQFYFKILMGKEWHEFIEISIINRSDGTLFQKFDIGSAQYGDYGKPKVYIEDFNFDGFLDFRYKPCGWCDGTSNIYMYEHYLYNSQNNTFVYDSILSDMHSTVFDQQSKLISQLEEIPRESEHENYVVNYYAYTCGVPKMIAQTEKVILRDEDNRELGTHRLRKFKIVNNQRYIVDEVVLPVDQWGNYEDESYVLQSLDSFPKAKRVEMYKPRKYRKNG